MTRLVAGQYPMQQIYDVDLGAAKPCADEIVITQAGRTRFLGEWVGGEIIDDPPCASITPSGGTTGHDHSGGIMGRPIQRPLAFFDLGAASNVSSHVLNSHACRASRTSSTPSGERCYLFNSHLIAFWVPGAGGPESGNAHRAAQMVLLLQSDQTITVYAQVMSNGVHTSDTVRSTTLTLTPPATYAASAWALTDYVPLIPNAFQNIHLDVWIEGSGGGSDTIVDLLSIGVHQVRDAP